MITESSNVATIKQGDAYNIPVKLFFNGVAISTETLSLLDEIEFALGDLDPVRIPASEAWSEALGEFLLPVTQEMTFALEVGKTDLDVRVQFLGGDVLGVREKARIRVIDATSETVL